MSYEVERIVITNWIRGREFFGLCSFGLDGNISTMVNESGWMNLLPGNAAQISVGSPGANLHQYVGVLAITVITEGVLGSGPGRVFADRIIDAFTGLKLDERGDVVAAGATTVIDFARAGVPYIADSTPIPPFHQTVVNCPYTRTERK